jgi:tRNA (mo5U34)-methyltransferase
MDAIMTIPTVHPRNYTEHTLKKYPEWFYEFTFSNGAKSEVVDPITRAIHQTRANLIFPFLDEFFRGRWPQIRCMDFACHQGWFSTQLALRGSGEVRGIDIRHEHVERALAIRELGPIANISFRQQNLYKVTADEDGTYELTLFLGILYHLDSPLEALRIARSLTKKLCVIETQVARSSSELHCLWGSGSPRKGPGIALVHSDETHDDRAGAIVEGVPNLVMVPTLSALYQMLYAAGFHKLYLTIPNTNMHEQYTDFDRVVIFAQAH